jgi:large subunit ribosomal protein L9
MRVILRENIENLGKKGDIVHVASGFGRNYLIPKKIAIEVTSRNKKMIEIEQKALQKGFEKEKASYQELIDRLDTITLSFTRKTSETDVIFGSVSSTDIRDALVAQGFEVEKKKILLDEPIKRLGNYTVPIKIFHEERAEVKLQVVKEGESVVQEDTQLSPEPVEEKEELPIPEEKKEDVTAPVEEKAQDVPAEVREEPNSAPAIVEEIPVEAGTTSEGFEESPEEAAEIPEEPEEIPKEEEKPEPMVELEVTESEKETGDEPSVEETEEALLETHEEPLDAQEIEPGEKPEKPGVIPEEDGEIPEEAEKSPEDIPEAPEETKESPIDTSTASPEPEGKTEEDDSQEAKSKDNK